MVRKPTKCLSFFVFAERSPPPPSGRCSFPRVPSSRLFNVCTLKHLSHPPAAEIFHAFLPSAFFMFGLFVCVEYLLPDTGHMCVPSFLRSFVFSDCFSFCFRIFVRLCFLVFSLLMRAYYLVPQGQERWSNMIY